MINLTIYNKYCILLSIIREFVKIEANSMMKKLSSGESMKYKRPYIPLLFSMLPLTPFSFTKVFKVRALRKKCKPEEK